MKHPNVFVAQVRRVPRDGFAPSPSPPSLCVGRKYIVIGGQHIVSALQSLYTETLASKRKPPEWMSTVSATILRHSSPPDARKFAAGRHQYQQTNVSTLRLSEVLALFLAPDVQALPTAGGRLQMVLQKAGHKDQAMRPVCRPILPPFSCGPTTC